MTRVRHDPGCQREVAPHECAYDVPNGGRCTCGATWTRPEYRARITALESANRALREALEQSMIGPSFEVWREAAEHNRRIDEVLERTKP